MKAFAPCGCCRSSPHGGPLRYAQGYGIRTGVQQVQADYAKPMAGWADLAIPTTTPTLTGVASPTSAIGFRSCPGQGRTGWKTAPSGSPRPGRTVLRTRHNVRAGATPTIAGTSCTPRQTTSGTATPNGASLTAHRKGGNSQRSHRARPQHGAHGLQRADRATNRAASPPSPVHWTTVWPGRCRRRSRRRPGGSCRLGSRLLQRG